LESFTWNILEPGEVKNPPLPPRCSEAFAQQTFPLLLQRQEKMATGSELISGWDFWSLADRSDRSMMITSEKF